MKKLILFTIFYLLFGHYFFGQSFQWAKAGNSDEAYKMVRDEAGNFIVADWQSVAKYDPMGNFIWQQIITGTAYDIRGIAVDTSGNLYVTGAFGGTINIGTDTFVSEAGGDANMFLVKYNTSGIIQWVARSHSNEDSGTDAITIDKQGNPIIIGRFIDSLRLDSFVFDAPSTNQIFLAKYSPAGICLWAKHLKSNSFSGGSNGPEIRSDELGNTFISGHFSSQAKFDSLQVFAFGGSLSDIFLTKIDSSGNFLWAKVLGGNYPETSRQMDVDDIGNTYISGYFESPIAYFDSYTLTTSSYSYFTAKYNTNGNCKWVKHGNAGFISAANDGYYTNSPSFINKYDTLGNLQWIKSVPGANNYAMVADDNDVYITGSYIGSVNFDTCSLSSATNQMYIAKLSSPVITTNLQEQVYNADFSVYPNPASRIITISISSNIKGALTLRIINALGKTIYIENLKGICDPFTKQIDLSHLPKGIYFAELLPNSSDKDAKKQVKKIILQ